MLATRAMAVSVGPHKGWTWTGTWNRTLDFSYKVPTTRSTFCFSFSHLSTIAPPNIRISRPLADGPTFQP